MAAAISAFAGCIIAGTSVAGTTLQAVVSGIDYNVACGVEVANWTKYMLEDPCVSVNGGLIRTPPVHVLPGEKEIMVTHKVGHTACGTSGVVSWRIRGKCRVYVMWSVPYNHDFYDNWLAIGIHGTATHSDRFNQMYYDDSGTWFRREKYQNTSNEVRFSNEDFVVTGTMGRSHKPTINITVRPQKSDDYCDSIKKQLKIA